MKPIVAMVGRPNVGKSTLFNRLVGGSPAIVHDQPGVTRDRHYADAHMHGREVTLVDTGGFDPTTEDPMGRGIGAQVRAAIQEADLVLCVFDGNSPPTEPDAEAVKLLRQSGKPTLFVANKIDRPDRVPVEGGLYELGISNPLPISALHGRGIAELMAEVVQALPPRVGPAPLTKRGPTVALMGRPNAGKSSLFNHLCGSERVLVDSRPGTTRDPIDTPITYKGKSLLLVDTAGVRRRVRVDTDVEAASVMRAIRSIDRARVIALMIDITEGIAEQDLRLLRLATDRGRGVVIGLSKSDLVGAKLRKEAILQAAKRLSFANWVPIVTLSTKAGDGIDSLMKAVLTANDELQRRVPTGELNRFMAQVIEKQPPPTHGGRAPRIYYLTQAKTDPPIFVAMTNAPDHIKESYKRFMSNQIRKAFGFGSIPLRVQFRLRARRETPHD